MRKKLILPAFFAALAVAFSACNSGNTSSVNSGEKLVSSALSLHNADKTPVAKALNSYKGNLTYIGGNDNYIFAVGYSSSEKYIIRYNKSDGKIDKKIAYQVLGSEFFTNENGIYIKTLNNDYVAYNNDLEKVLEFSLSNIIKDKKQFMWTQESALSDNFDKIAYISRDEKFEKLMLYNIASKKSKLICKVEYPIE